MPVTIMEALSNGLPIITTRVGGIPEIINDTNGILVPEKDSNALRNAIKGIISCKDDNVILRNNAMRSSVNYDWEHIAKKYERILATI
jgi:glycosyltransferase involved in cell wall biosynthesis